MKQVEYPVAFFGVFSAGKSTIINAILQRDILPENGAKATTAFPTFIRYGKKDEATIFYLDEKGKDELRGQLICQIAMKLKVKEVDMPTIVIKDKNLKNGEQYLSEVKNAISKYEKDSNVTFDDVNFDKLSYLIKNWNNHNGESGSIQLDDLSQYVEGHKDSLLIHRIEVYINNTDLPDDVILVDLPGLGVNNPTHVKFTKDYIRDKAKAVVVCLQPLRGVEGEEALFLNEIKKTAPTVLSRSFWLINQWDLTNDLQKEQQQDHFTEKTRSFFRITDDRFFKVSALRYSLVCHLINETLKSSKTRLREVSHIKEFFPTLSSDNIPDDAPAKAKKLLEEQPEIRDFESFRLGLFEYLNVTAKQEFLTDARSELMNCVLELRGHLNPLHEAFANVTDLKKSWEFNKVQKELYS